GLSSAAKLEFLVRVPPKRSPALKLRLSALARIPDMPCWLARKAFGAACVVPAAVAPIGLLGVCLVSADASAAIAMDAATVTQNSSCFDLIRNAPRVWCWLGISRPGQETNVET